MLEIGLVRIVLLANKQFEGNSFTIVAGFRVHFLLG